MIPILLIVFIVLIIVGIFLTDSAIIKSIIVVILAIAAGGGIYYYMSKINEPCNNYLSEGANVPVHHVKQKWGGIGLSRLCKTYDADDDSFLRIATDADVDVLASKYGMESTYGNLSADQSGDSQLALRSRFQSEKNKQAVINRSKFTADSIRMYFEDELSHNENIAWWDNDELDAYT